MNQTIQNLLDYVTQLRSLQQLSVLKVIEADPTIWEEEGTDEVVRELVERPEDDSAAPLLMAILIKRESQVDE